MNFFVHFLDLDSILNIFRKKMTLRADVFLSLETGLGKCLKSPVSEDPLTSNMVNGPKHWWKLNDSNFTILIDHSEGRLGWKNLSE